MLELYNLSMLYLPQENAITEGIQDVEIHWQVSLHHSLWLSVSIFIKIRSSLVKYNGATNCRQQPLYNSFEFKHRRKQESENWIMFQTPPLLIFQSILRNHQLLHWTLWAISCCNCRLLLKWILKFDQELQQQFMSYAYDDYIIFWQILSAVHVQTIMQICSQLLKLCAK